jgi:hypothetical protein
VATFLFLNSCVCPAPQSHSSFFKAKKQYIAALI